MINVIDNKTIILPASFIRNKAFRTESRAESFSPYSIYNAETDLIKNLSEILQHNEKDLKSKLISPMEYKTEFNNNKLNHSCYIYVADNLKTLEIELNEIQHDNFQKLRNLNMEPNGRKFAVFLHIYLLQSIIHYLPDILAKDNILLAKGEITVKNYLLEKSFWYCHYFLQVYLLEELLPPTAGQKYFFSTLKEKTTEVIEKFLKLEIPKPTLTLPLLFEMCLITYAGNCFCFRGPQICFLNIVFKRYFKEFYRKIKPGVPIEHEKEQKVIENKMQIKLNEKNKILNIADHLGEVSGNIDLFKFFSVNTTSLYNYAKNPEYPQNIINWSDYNIPYITLIGSRNEIIEYPCIDQFFAAFETPTSHLKYKLIFISLNNPEMREFCKTISMWYQQPKISEIKQLSPEKLLCLHFCAIDSIIKYVHQYTQANIKNPEIEKLVFGAYLQLSCIEEMLNLKSKQNMLLIRVKKKCIGLLQYVLSNKGISTIQPTTFFIRNFETFFSNQKHVLSWSMLNLLDHKFARYRREYFHFTGEDDHSNS